MHYVTVPAARGDVTRTVTATGTVNPVLTIIVGSYVFRRHPASLLRLQHTGEGGPGLRQDRSAPLSGDARPIFRPAAARSGHARQGPDRSRALSATRRRRTRSRASRPRTKPTSSARTKATVKLDQALVEGAKLNLDYTDIVSPVDGTVVSRNVTRADRRRQLSDADAVSDRHRPQEDAGRHQCQRKRHRRHQGRRQGDLHRRRLSAARVPRHRDAGPPVAADGAECRDL